MTNAEIDDHYQRVKLQSEKVQDDMLFDKIVRDCKQGELSDEEIEQRLENCGRTRADLKEAMKRPRKRLGKSLNINPNR